LYIELEISLLW